MRITNLFLLLISIAAFTSGCNSAPSKGKMISDCMGAGGSPEECDRKYN